MKCGVAGMTMRLHWITTDQGQGQGQEEVKNHLWVFQKGKG